MQTQTLNVMQLSQLNRLNYTADNSPLPNASVSVAASFKALPTGAYFHPVQFGIFEPSKKSLTEFTAGYRPGVALDEEDVKTLGQGFGTYHIEKAGANDFVIVGRDTRVSSREHHELAVKQFSDRGIHVLNVEGALSTPVASYVAKNAERLKTQGLIPQAFGKPSFVFYLTASHNPYPQGGIKFLGPNGVNASTDLLKEVDIHLANPQPNLRIAEPGEAIVHNFDPNKPYFEDLGKIIDFNAIKNAKMKLYYDAHYGTGQPFGRFLKDDLSLNVELSRMEDPKPEYESDSEPVPKNLEEMLTTIKKGGFDVGIANDGDADRFAAVDETGKMISVTDILAIAMWQLQQKYTGKFVRSQATSHFLDELYTNLTGRTDVIVTPVGFKYVGNEIQNAEGSDDPVLLGAEGSGGATSGHHTVFEKDGIFIDSLVLEAAADQKANGQTISQLVNNLRDRVPTKYAMLEAKVGASDLQAAGKDKDEIIRHFENYLDSSSNLNAIGNFKVNKTLSQTKSAELLKNYKKPDGVKLFFEDGSWVLFRPSGTENLFRIYLEGVTPPGSTQNDANKKRQQLWKAVTTELGSQFGLQLTDNNIKNSDPEPVG